MNNHARRSDRYSWAVVGSLAVLWVATGFVPGIALAESPTSDANSTQQSTIRVASYNVSLYRERSGDLARELSGGNSTQAVQLARVIQSASPDVLLLCEFDYEADAKALNRFADEYLAVDQYGAGSAIDYPHRLSLPSNTGLFSKLDLNADGKTELPSDGWGFGRYEGQYAMAVLSRFPIDDSAVRTFQQFRWADFPGALRPVDPKTGEPFHSDEVWAAVRLSSKNHADVPIEITTDTGKRTLHFLVSHPTPPVFDGPEDLNGCRNHDEIQFWNTYISGDADALVDDNGTAGGLPSDASFVIAGDLNSDPTTGDSRREAIASLLGHERTQDTEPQSGAYQGATASFNRGFVRVDYVLPSSDWTVVASGVVWPSSREPLAKEVRASDHRMVWVDLK